MIRVVNRETGEMLGTIQDADLEIMRQALEEEGEDDRDYFLADDTLELLVQRGLSSDAQTLLRNGFKDGAIEFGAVGILSDS